MIAGVLVLLLISWIGDWLANRILVALIRRIVARSPFTWDDILLDDKVLSRAAHFVPTIILYVGLPLVPGMREGVQDVARAGLLAVLVVLFAMVLSRLLHGVNELYSRRPDAVERPIKGYIQLLQLGVFIVAGILVVSSLTSRDPGVLLGGVGAFTAVLLLVFRDTILSLVASLQLTSNDMVRIGDWIEMPKYGADGDVIEIALHTVKVQNWDKTITTIPTHRLIEDSFRNWRGMSQAGGRRIKRALILDMNSVRFLSEDEIRELGRWELLREYISNKQDELSRWREGRSVPEGVLPHDRHLTNLGTFRAYVGSYLRHHPGVHQGMTLLVRQLAPSDAGIPLEIYCFTSDTAWANYEAIQGDIFDHLVAILPEFGLRVYQSPSGRDVTQVARAVSGLEGEPGPGPGRGPIRGSTSDTPPPTGPR
jgi:miniconductance mechanosensitive channel